MTHGSEATAEAGTAVPDTTRAGGTPDRGAGAPGAPGATGAPRVGDWVAAGTVDDLRARGKVLVERGERRVLVLWHEDAPHALDDTCIHKGRELSRGVVLNGRIVCPGHQWAFDVATGHCRERDRCQPRYAVRVDDGVVHVDVSAPVDAG